MSADSGKAEALLHRSTVRTAWGCGSLARLGELAARESASHVLLVTDPGIVAAGHAARAQALLQSAGLKVTLFDGVMENPTPREVEAGLAVAGRAGVDFFIGLGGGSSLDCMKGINLLLTNGGVIADYWGINKATRPMLPMIAIPTTAGTGSEAQSFALISDAATHRKMACGDRRPPEKGGLRPRWAILDPELLATQPIRVARVVGLDAVAHAVETAASTASTAESLALSVAAWELLSASFDRVAVGEADAGDRENMLLGAHLAGAAIERSMLGAAHACANPLTARFGIVHGHAVGLMLPHVVRFNTEPQGLEQRGLDPGINSYAALPISSSDLIEKLSRWLAATGLPSRLSHLGIQRDDLPALAEAAAAQWTAGFNPRKASGAGLLEIYQSAY